MPSSLRGRLAHGREDLLVPGAAAEVAREGLLDLLVAGVVDRSSRAVADISWPGMQKPHCAALLSRKASCSGSSSPSRGQALDGQDVGAVGLDRQHQAGVDRAPVDEHRAGAALAHDAAFLGAGQADVVAQHFEQRVMDGHVELARAAVDGQARW